jgi:hypothetical protein
MMMHERVDDGHADDEHHRQQGEQRYDFDHKWLF